MDERPKSALQGAPLTKGAVVLLAIIIFLSLLSFLVYIQMRDYHDAKYRAQYYIVEGMVADMTIVSSSLTQIADYPPSDEAKDRTALIETVRLHELSNSARTISAMYSGDDEKSHPFTRVSQAFTHVETTLGSYIGAWNQSTGWMSELRDFGQEISALAAEFEKGFDFNKSPSNNPYSLVDRMDLNKITSIAGEIYPIPPVVF